MEQYAYASEVYMKIGDTEALVMLQVEAKLWDEVRRKNLSSLRSTESNCNLQISSTYISSTYKIAKLFESAHVQANPDQSQCQASVDDSEQLQVKNLFKIPTQSPSQRKLQT